MNRPDDIRKTVSKTYTIAVEQTKATSGACCSGPAPEGLLTSLAGHSRAALAAILRMAHELAGKVAGIRVVGSKPVAVRP